MTFHGIARGPDIDDDEDEDDDDLLGGLDDEEKGKGDDDGTGVGDWAEQSVSVNTLEKLDFLQGLRGADVRRNVFSEVMRPWKAWRQLVIGRRAR